MNLYPGITDTTLVAEIRRLAAEMPGRVYVRPRDANGYVDACSNINSGDMPGQGCIVGMAFINLGIPRGVLAIKELPPEERPEGVTGERDSRAVIDWLGLDISPPVKTWTRAVQIGQDDGIRWDVCVNEADRAH
jgi:hypothetical protein